MATLAEKGLFKVAITYPDGHGGIMIKIIITDSQQLAELLTKADGINVA